MVTGVDFLPAEYWKRRASRRDQYYLLAIGGALILLLIASFGHETRKASLIRMQLAAADAEYQDALSQAAEVQRLEERRVPLAFDAEFYALLRAYPSVSRTLVAVASSCPPHVTLKSVALRSVRESTSDAPKSAGRSKPSAPSTGPAARREQLDRFAKDRQHTRLSIQIDGVSATDPDVTDLVARLERSECFSSVTFTVSENASTGPIELRKFTIQCWLTKVL
jgi:Tfp pilus assembly protein PilN